MRPGNDLSVRIESVHNGARVFAATLIPRRHELTAASMRWATASYPFATLRVLGLIYLHAGGLRLAGVRTSSYPSRARA